MMLGRVRNWLRSLTSPGVAGVVDEPGDLPAPAPARGTDGSGRPAAARTRRPNRQAGRQAPPATRAGTIIPRDQHTVSRKLISANALRVLYRLRDAGFQAYLVGGAVRDMLLGIVPKDFDVATDARPEQIKQQFRNCRLIGRRFRLAHIHYGQEIIEVATFRGSGTGEGIGDVDQESVTGRLLRDNTYGTLEEDIFRRDFTANALYYNIADFSIRDDVGGVADIQARRLRMIGDPEARFREDPVRMLRAVRFAAKLDFEIDAQSTRVIPQLAYLLGEVPPARLFDETGKLLLMGSARRGFHLLREHGLLPALMPQVANSLAGDGGEAFGRFVDAALTSSDTRIAEGKPLTPGFLLAVLLWPEAQRVHAALIAEGSDTVSAWQRATDAVVGPFCQRVAVPRRLSFVTQDIWTLQHWLAQRSRRRVARVLAHPRFRAAFDFLALRAVLEPQLQETFDWWRDAQTLDSEALDTHIESTPSVGNATEPGRKRRGRGGRRRRGRGEGGSPPPESG
jgi:poly(A) polymerase